MQAKEVYAKPQLLPCTNVLGYFLFAVKPIVVLCNFTIALNTKHSKHGKQKKRELFFFF